MNIEVCIDNLESLPLAIAGGANRIELCSSLALGGVTPSYGMIKQAITMSSVPVFVMIRPRQGDFVYSHADVVCMLDDIQMAKELGAHGVVFGAVTAQGEIDQMITQQLIQASNGLGITFHRAFDHCQDPYQSLETLIKLGCDRVLTSGLASSAMAGIEVLKKLTEQAKGRIEIMAGAGVNASNAKTLILQAKVDALHLSAKGTRKSEMLYMPNALSMGKAFVDDFEVPITQSENLRQLIEAIK